LVSFGANADHATFNGDVSAASIYGGTGDDTFFFGSNVVDGAQFGGGAGADKFGGVVSVGSSGVSFWGGAGADSFNFGNISNNAGTAYFWNDVAGKDTIVFDAAAYSNSNNFAFGVTSGSQLAIDLNAAVTGDFASAGVSSLFQFAEASNLATIAFSADAVTLTFAGGTDIMLNGNAGFTQGFNTAFATGVITGAVATTTALFGNTSVVIPSFS
jgi:hypothetical protein